MPQNFIEERVINALYDKTSVTVYQAYRSEIAGKVVRNQTFKNSLFKVNRMTWIKLSFLWMMYRSGWTSKENQEKILSINITRDGWEWALEHSCLTHFDSRIYKTKENWKNLLSRSPVRIQWDPEKDIHSNDLRQKTIQVGLKEIAIHKYVDEWVVCIKDITQYCKHIESLILNGNVQRVHLELPNECSYPLPLRISKIIGQCY